MNQIKPKFKVNDVVIPDLSVNYWNDHHKIPLVGFILTIDPYPKENLIWYSVKWLSGVQQYAIHDKEYSVGHYLPEELKLWAVK